MVHSEKRPKIDFQFPDGFPLFLPCISPPANLYFHFSLYFFSFHYGFPLFLPCISSPSNLDFHFSSLVFLLLPIWAGRPLFIGLFVTLHNFFPLLSSSEKLGVQLFLRHHTFICTIIKRLINDPGPRQSPHIRCWLKEDDVCYLYPLSPS